MRHGCEEDGVAFKTGLDAESDGDVCFSRSGVAIHDNAASLPDEVQLSRSLCNISGSIVQLVILLIILNGNRLTDRLTKTCL